ncbi:MAG: DNA-3-methyladenine glycosylase [Actinomycetota bacterium]|nr:DNA-3-methyladenine glycosylase [Actinomycetota bacterium]
MENILPRNFYKRDTAEVARSLLGKALIKYDGEEMAGGVITETEAYYGQDDPASHAYSGETPRSSIMFEKPGTVYVYLCYGMYHLINIVTEEEGRPGAVLVRALEPVWGIDIMRHRRNGSERLTDGPGRLTIALGIGIEDNGTDIVKAEGGLRIFDFKRRDTNFRIARSRRVGINKGGDKLLRFIMLDK